MREFKGHSREVTCLQVVVGAEGKVLLPWELLLLLGSKPPKLLLIMSQRLLLANDDGQLLKKFGAMILLLHFSEQDYSYDDLVHLE